MKRHTIIIPSKQNNKAPIPPQVRADAIKYAVTKLTKEHKGTTRKHGQGTWLASNGDIISEVVTEIEVYGPADTVRATLLVIADKLKKELSQESMFITSNGKGELI